MELTLVQKESLAKLAYEPDMGVISGQLGGMFGFGALDIEFIYVERTDTEGFMARVGDDCIISFSGTESLKDIKQDIIFHPTRYRGGWLHAGFKQIIDLVKRPVLRSFRNLFGDDSVRQIYAMGHSLGAPIAMGACEALYNRTPHDSRNITTFGCPNGWSRGARQAFNARHPDMTNYINPGDYVTWLLGITTGRPGKDVKLSGKWGHMMSKYGPNVAAHGR